jgi:hypothetical protein
MFTFTYALLHMLHGTHTGTWDVNRPRHWRMSCPQGHGYRGVLLSPNVQGVQSVCPAWSW